MKKCLVYLLILSLLLNIPLPVFAQIDGLTAGPNSISTVPTDTDEMDALEELLIPGDKEHSVSGKTYKEQLTFFIKDKIEPPIKNEIMELHTPQNGSVVDFIYGHSAYYDTLKKHNRLDLLGKLSAKEQSVSEKVYKYQNESVEDKLYQEQKESIVDSVYTEQYNSVSKEVYETTEQKLSAMITQSSANQAWYNTLVGPSVMNGVNNEKYSAWADTEEIISPQTGDLTIKQTDIKLPGRNGLDLAISRIYQSNQSMFGDRRISGDGSYGYNDYSTYYLNRYALGMGWSLGFPSIQIEEEGGNKELYYHTGEGNVYHVNFSAGTYSNLENYYLKDAKFNNDTSFSNGQVTSQYSFVTADQTKRYFAADGRLTGVVDRFGNQIIFKHTEKPVTNRTPNNDFEYPENQGIWTTNGYYSYDQTFGKDDTTSLKFSGSGTSQSSFSSYVPVLPNTKYYLSGYIYNQLTSGNAQLTYREYNQNYNEIKRGAAKTSAVNNAWELLSQNFVTSSNAKYIKIEFSNTSASGKTWIDKVRFDRAWPLISEITDSIGRKVTFKYNDKLYEENSDGGTITVKVSDPSLTNSHTLTYTRGKCIYNFHWSTWDEQRRYPRLYSYYDGELYNYYDYTYPEEKYSFWEKTVSNYSGWSSRPLLNAIYPRNSKTTYEYQKTTKHLGADGFYETHRIAKRYEQKAYSDGYSGTNYRRTYSYSGNHNGTNYNNETGYPGPYSLYENPNYQFTGTVKQDNGLVSKETYKGKRKFKTEQSHSSGEKEITYYEEYHSSFKDNVTKIKNELYNPGGSVFTLYTGYAYNDWGGVASETAPLTPTQWNNSAVKNQHTISYTYDSKHKFLKTKSYYQNPGLMLTESTNYDSTGRATSTTNAKGEITKYTYGDANHPGNLTRSRIYHSDGRITRTDYDYTGAYFAFPAIITGYYTEAGVQKTGTTIKNYEFIRGNVLSEEDALGSITSYEYDLQGRIKKITYPASTGQNGDYVVEDNFEYDNYIYPGNPSVEDPQRTFRVRNYKTENGSLFSDAYSYYDDHGNLLLAMYWDYDRGIWVPATYGYNKYGQLTWTKDANGYKTKYLSDEWNRLKKVTDPQGNFHTFDYDITNRTKTTTFTPADTGMAENHYVETYDQWGRTISRKGFPDGPSGAAVEEKYEYDLAGNVTKIIDANNNNTIFGYDALNRLNKVTNALAETTDYDYDRLGNLTQIKQYQGADTYSTTKQYDERGLMVSRQLPAGQPGAYKYNANGLPVEIIAPSGKITTMQYYADNSLAEKRTNQDRIQYYYSPLGGVEKYQPVNDTTGYGEPLTFDFYSTGLTKQRRTANYNVGFEYDILGNKTKVTDPFGLSTNYQYNKLNRLTKVTADGKNFTYEYYPDGMVKAVNYPQLANGTSIRAEYTYDNINRLTTMTNKLGSQVITQYSYNYDNNGNIIAITENGQTANYTYDALNRLTGIRRPSGEQITYQYDTRGNRVIASVNDKSLDGFISGEFDYNNWDQLAAFTTGGDTYNYHYDPEGLRTQKTTPAGTTRYHLDDSGMVIAESNDGGTATAQNIWGINALARKINGAYYYYIYNGHGDVVKVIDANGVIINNYSYDEWGNILFMQEQLPQPLKYAGEYFDDESGLYYLRARYYDPTIGRFISRDTLEGDITNPLTLNQYTYVENDPLGYVDPSGHFSIGAVIRTAVSVAVSVISSMSRSSGSSKSSSSSVPKSSSSSKPPGILVASLTMTGILNDLGAARDQFSKQNLQNAWDNAIEYGAEGGRVFGEFIYDTGESIYNEIAPIAKEWWDTPFVGGRVKGPVNGGFGIIKGIKGAGKTSLNKLDTKIAEKIAIEHGYTGAEDLKKAYVGKSQISKFNMKVDKKTGEIVLEGIQNGAQVRTGVYKK